MNWDSIQQIIRILLYTGGGAVLGDAVVKSDLYQQAVGGIIAIGAFCWWYFWERKRKATP